MPNGSRNTEIRRSSGLREKSADAFDARTGLAYGASAEYLLAMRMRKHAKRADAAASL